MAEDLTKHPKTWWKDSLRPEWSAPRSHLRFGSVAFRPAILDPRNAISSISTLLLFG